MIMSQKKKQIFVVDDDASVCRALGVLLGTYGFIVDTFTSAEEFFRAVPNSVAGCLILDIHMPGQDGWETLQRLTTTGSTRQVIMISAEKNENIKERALKSGAAGYLQKPFNNDELFDLIKVSCENHTRTHPKTMSAG